MSFYKNIGRVEEISKSQIKALMIEKGYRYRGTISTPEQWCTSDFVTNLMYTNDVVLNLTDNMLYRCKIDKNIKGIYAWEKLPYVVVSYYKIL